MFIDVQLKFNFANRSDEFPFHIVISILCSFVVWVFFSVGCSFKYGLCLS